MAIRLFKRSWTCLSLRCPRAFVRDGCRWIFSSVPEKDEELYGYSRFSSRAGCNGIDRGSSRGREPPIVGFRTFIFLLSIIDYPIKIRECRELRSFAYKLPPLSNNKYRGDITVLCNGYFNFVAYDYNIGWLLFIGI